VNIKTPGPRKFKKFVAHVSSQEAAVQSQECNASRDAQDEYSDAWDGRTKVSARFSFIGLKKCLKVSTVARIVGLDA